MSELRRHIMMQLDSFEFVEHIVLESKEYILLGDFIPNNNTEIEFYFAHTTTTNTRGTMAGARVGVRNQSFYFQDFSPNGFRVEIGNTVKEFAKNTADTNWHKIEYKNHYIYVDDVSYGNYPATAFISLPFLVHGLNNNGGLEVRISQDLYKSFVVRENGVLTHQYEPVLFKTGKYGLYNLITGKLHKISVKV